MPNNELSSVWHDRIRLDDYDEFYKNIPERDLNHHDVTSPFDAWSIIKLRSRLHAQQIGKIPTDIMIWGRGEPKVPTGTKVGGAPVWPKDRPLPPAKKNV